MHGSWKTVPLFFFALFFCDAIQTMAQEDQSAQQEAVRKLQDQMDKLKTQMTEIQSQLDALKGINLPHTGSIETTPPPPPPMIPEISEEEEDRAAGAATRRHQTFGGDEEDAPRIYNAPLEIDLPGFFHLPGTQTMLRLDGSIRTDLIYDPNTSGLSDSFVTSSIPIPRISGSEFNTSIRGSRFMTDFRIPLGKYGQARTFMQFDFFGANGATAIRLRHFYAQADNFLVGQTFTNFMDPDAFPDTLDTQGPNAGISVRIPQLRYGFGFGSGSSVYFSAETPSSNIAFSVDGEPAVPTTPAPDGTVRFLQEWERGHLQLAADFRDLSARLPDNLGRESVFGWGLNATSEMSIYGLDTAVVQVAYGHGISRYVGDTAALNLDAAPKSATDLSLQAIPVFATYGSYQHYWKPSVRSNATFSFVQVSNTEFQPVTTFHKSTYSSANLIWNPLGSLDLGVEFLYGWVGDKGGFHSDVPRVQFTGRYTFVKLHKEEQAP